MEHAEESKSENSKAALRERENHECIGGLRNPHLAQAKIPGLRATGNLLDEVLQRFLDAHPEAVSVVDAIGKGPPSMLSLLCFCKKTWLRHSTLINFLCQ